MLTCWLAWSLRPGRPCVGGKLCFSFRLIPGGEGCSVLPSIEGVGDEAELPIDRTG